jgi:hypothetical protein
VARILHISLAVLEARFFMQSDSVTRSEELDNEALSENVPDLKNR